MYYKAEGIVPLFLLLDWYYYVSEEHLLPNHTRSKKMFLFQVFVNCNITRVLGGHTALYNSLSWPCWQAQPQQELDGGCMPCWHRERRPVGSRRSISTNFLCFSLSSVQFPHPPAWSGTGLFGQTSSRGCVYYAASPTHGEIHSCRSVSYRWSISWFVDQIIFLNLKESLPPACMVSSKHVEPLLFIVGKFDNSTSVMSSVPS